MFTRRTLLERFLKGSSLIAAGPLVPGFLASTARAASPGEETILVVLELTGGNDGLNTIVPYADDQYQRARPTLKLAKEQVVRLDDQLGLNPGLRGLELLLSADQVAIVQGVGYPNPDRSHFESMDIWQSADPSRTTGNGWLGRGLGSLSSPSSAVPGIHVGASGLPMALRGPSATVPTVHPSRPFDLELAPGGPSSSNNDPFGQIRFSNPGRQAAPRPSGDDPHLAPRRRLIEELAELAPQGDPLQRFVRRSTLQTYEAVERIREIVGADRSGNGSIPFDPRRGSNRDGLGQDLQLVADLIAAELGTRIFYVSQPGYDTHAGQLSTHEQLLRQLGDSVAGFFQRLEQSGHARRVLLLTFSEFGRRVQENGSQGTDHGAASCQFLIGPAVQGGVIGRHPALNPDQLEAGDLKHHTDFRQVYATLLEGWLGCDSKEVLGDSFEPLPLLRF
ncbi:DUF1501 domain-containing protein [soil metagenome]